MKSDEQISAAGALYATITEKALEAAIQKGVDAGVKSAMSYIETERQKAVAGRQDRRLHNTRLLLKNYRLLKQAAVGAIYKSAQAKERAIDILDGLEGYSMTDGLYIESIRNSQQRTIIILAHIDQALELYSAYCSASNLPEDIRRYNIIMETYIIPQRRSAQEIADRYGVEKRTIYKDITAAIEPITALIFGIDGMKTF